MVRGRTLRMNFSAARIVISALFVAVAIAPGAHAQTFTVLHTFTGADGGEPRAGLTMDAAGNLYGTTYSGGVHSSHCFQAGCGTIFRLHPSGQGWTLTSLYSFHFTDGAQPEARVMFGPDGALYGTTFQGGTGPCTFYGCGTVFNLRPPSTVCRSAPCEWNETVVLNFSGPDGAYPGFGDLNFDSAGHMYGTTAEGGTQANGTVFELTKLPNGEWTENIDYNFTQISGKGANPNAGVLFDSAGNMYTPTALGGYGYQRRCGDVVQLTNSPSGWTENDLYTFPCFAGGEFPVGGLIFDREGNLYGTTWEGGTDGGGLVYELSPSNGSWVFNILYSNFSGGAGPEASLTMDAAGNLYGTTSTDGRHASGTVFKLTPSNGGWTYNTLYTFTGGSDGAQPISNIIFDANGNLYGTASAGGNTAGCPGGCGVVWEITP